MIYPQQAHEDVRALRHVIAAKPDLQSRPLRIGSGIDLVTKWYPDSDML